MIPSGESSVRGGRTRFLAGLFVLVGLVGITGCAVSSSPSDPSPPSRGPTESRTEEELTELFVNRARQLIDRARYAEAESYLDRATGLRPEHPGIWYQMARLRRAQERLRQAEVLARKSLDLIEENRELRIDAWRLIADVRFRRGDSEGARRARERADRLEGGW